MPYLVQIEEKLQYSIIRCVVGDLSLVTTL